MFSERSGTTTSPDGTPDLGATAGDGESGHSNDLFRRVAHILLVAYLLPAIVIVLAVSGVAMVVTGLAKGVSRVFSGPPVEPSLVTAGMDELPDP